MFLYSFPSEFLTCFFQYAFLSSFFLFHIINTNLLFSLFPFFPLFSSLFPRLFFPFSLLHLFSSSPSLLHFPSSFLLSFSPLSLIFHSSISVCLYSPLPSSSYTAGLRLHFSPGRRNAIFGTPAWVTSSKRRQLIFRHRIEPWRPDWRGKIVLESDEIGGGRVGEIIYTCIGWEEVGASSGLFQYCEDIGSSRE